MKGNCGFLVRIFLCVAVVASALPAYGRAVATARASFARPQGAEETQRRTAAPLEMSVETAGAPETGLELRVTLRSGLASVRAEVTVTSPGGALSPGGGAAWRRAVTVTRDGETLELFQVAPTPKQGGRLVVEAVSDGRPNYYAKIGYTVTLRGGTPQVERVSYPATEGGQPEAVQPPAEPVSVAEVEEVTPACANCTTVKGRFNFLGPQGTTEYPWEATVVAWDYDAPYDVNNPADDYVGLGFIDRSGNFQISYSSFKDEDGTDPDLYFVIRADSKKQKVVDPVNFRVYEYRTPHGQIQWDLKPNVTYDIGNIRMNLAGNTQLAFFVYRWMSQGWHYVRDHGGSVATDDAYVVFPSDGMTNWPHDRPHGVNDAHFVPPPPLGPGQGTGFGEIHIGSGVLTKSVILHEYGHYMMFRLNNNSLRWWNPDIIYGGHSMDEPMWTKAGAWFEGWADYFAVAASGDSRYYWTSTVWIDLENWSCNGVGGCDGNGGEYIEGRIAATLLDLIDAPADGENVLYPHATIIDVMDEAVLVDFMDFFMMWVNKGLPCGTFVQLANKNTINSVGYQCGGEQAIYENMSVPTKMDSGMSYPVWVRMRNNGAVPWREMGRIRLGSQSPQDNMTWGLNRVRLGPEVSVEPGDSYTFNFNVRAPQVPGTYPFQWKMVRDGQFWFEAPTPTKLIQVVCEAPPAVGTGVYDNSSGAVRYCGTWSYQTGGSYSQAHQATLHITDLPGATAAFRFNGSTLTYRYSMAPNRGAAEVFIDGVSRGTVHGYASEVRRQVARTWEVSPGAHVFELRAFGGTNSMTDLDAFQVNTFFYNPGAYDSESTALSYIGTWNGASNPTRRWSNVTGDAVTFNFKGGAIVYSYTTAANRGMAAVTIDGVDKGLIDLYSATTQFGRSKTFANLGAGPHTITITVSGKRNASATDQFVDVDSLQAVD